VARTLPTQIDNYEGQVTPQQSALEYQTSAGKRRVDFAGKQEIPIEHRFLSHALPNDVQSAPRAL